MNQIVICYPLGAGGNWLKSTLVQDPLLDKHYINFHKTDQHWVLLRHDVDNRSTSDLIFSGTAYFNFFVNHVYKHYYHEHDLFNTTNYNHYWPTIVAASYGICKYNKIINMIDFDFDNLIGQPEIFHKKLIHLQKTVNKPLIGIDDFFYRRSKFIASCVNIDTIVEQFDNPYWVAFVLGQLMIDNIYPSFSISEIDNQNLCKKFAQDNYHRCNLNKFINFDTETILPKLCG